MSNQFIYVFDEQGRDKLLSLQYEMLKCDEKNHVFVFLNKPQQYFEDGEFNYSLSNILTF